MEGGRRTLHAKGLRIATRCETAAEFVAKFHRFCEDSTIFIPNATRAVGAETAFSFDLNGGQPALCGLGTVLEHFTESTNRFGRPGILVAITRMQRSTQQVFTELLAARAAAKGPVSTAPEDEAPPPEAAAPPPDEEPSGPFPGGPAAQLAALTNLSSAPLARTRAMTGAVEIVDSIALKAAPPEDTKPRRRTAPFGVVALAPPATVPQVEKLPPPATAPQVEPLVPAATPPQIETHVPATTSPQVEPRPLATPAQAEAVHVAIAPHEASEPSRIAAPVPPELPPVAAPEPPGPLAASSASTAQPAIADPPRRPRPLPNSPAAFASTMLATIDHAPNAELAVGGSDAMVVPRLRTPWRYRWIAAGAAAVTLLIVTVIVMSGGSNERSVPSTSEAQTASAPATPAAPVGQPAPPTAKPEVATTTTSSAKPATPPIVKKPVRKKSVGKKRIGKKRIAQTKKKSAAKKSGAKTKKPAAKKAVVTTKTPTKSPTTTTKPPASKL